MFSKELWGMFLLHTHILNVASSTRLELTDRSIEYHCESTSAKVGPFMAKVGFDACGVSAQFLYLGLWLCKDKTPFLTLIGSPNFGYRSKFRDLEAQLAIVTDNSGLQERLRKEKDLMFEPSEVVSEATFEAPDRKVRMWEQITTGIIRSFF